MFPVTLRRLLPALALAAAPLFADTIEMLGTGLKMEGKVERETDEYIILMIHDDQGKIRIPKKLIKNIEYDIGTQLEKYPEDDHAGRLKVAKWAMEKGMYPEAIKLLEKLKAVQDDDKFLPPPEIRKMLGRAYEQRKQLDKALAAYDEYLLIKADDAEVVERRNAIAKEVNPAKTAEGTQAPKIVEGLEANDGRAKWVSETWGHPGSAQYTADKTTGNQMVVAVSNGGAADKAAFSRNGDPLDLSKSTEMLVRVFQNSNAPIQLAVAFHNAQGEFHESKQYRIPPQVWTDLPIKIDGKVFKAQRTDWKFEAELVGKEHTSRMTFLIYSAKPFTMYIDSLFFK